MWIKLPDTVLAQVPGIYQSQEDGVQSHICKFERDSIKRSYFLIPPAEETLNSSTIRG